MLDALIHLNSPLVIWGLFGAAVLLVLIDFLFPTDWPCQLGYFCFAAASFFIIPSTIAVSLTGALIVWLALVGLHFKLFHHFLSEPRSSSAGVARETTSSENPAVNSHNE